MRGAAVSQHFAAAAPLLAEIIASHEQWRGDRVSDTFIGVTTNAAEARIRGIESRARRSWPTTSWQRVTT